MRMVDSLRVTVRHYYHFGAAATYVGKELHAPEAWDALRIGSEGPFGMAACGDDWKSWGMGSVEIERRARALDALLEQRSAQRVASYGVGVGHTEMWLHRIRPNRELVITDYAPATIERLTHFFPEARVRTHDLASDPPLAADWHLFLRIDTEFTDSGWRSIFRRFASERILFLGGGIVGIRGLARELRERLHPGATAAGWVRTRAAAERLWHDTHAGTPFQAENLDGWILEPLNRRPRYLG
jgi:hypothetical protein